MLLRGILALTTCTIVSTAHAFTTPAYDAFVTDEAGILSAQEEQQLEATLESYRRETSNEIAVLLISTLDGEPIADAAVQVGREWGVGRDDVNNGILLLIAVDDREMFIATGYGLEGALPDLLASQIIENDITPSFREGNYFAGVQKGITALQAAIGGEYEALPRSNDEEINPFQIIMFIVFFVFPWLGAVLGRTKSWWLGGVIGIVVGIILWVTVLHVLIIPALGIVGLLFDYIVSKNYKPGRRRNPWYVGGGWGPGGGGGFGGFGGGSFGGGGARGRW